LAKLTIPVGTGWLLGACMEARGKQDLWIGQKPEVLEVLREQAIIQSAESSNRGHYRCGEPVAPSGDWKGQAAGPVGGGTGRI
jgi:hypothetical protein